MKEPKEKCEHEWRESRSGVVCIKKCGAVKLPEMLDTPQQDCKCPRERHDYACEQGLNRPPQQECEGERCMRAEVGVPCSTHKIQDRYTDPQQTTLRAKVEKALDKCWETDYDFDQKCAVNKILELIEGHCSEESEWWLGAVEKKIQAERQRIKEAVEGLRSEHLDHCEAPDPPTCAGHVFASGNHKAIDDVIKIIDA